MSLIESKGRVIEEGNLRIGIGKPDVTRYGDDGYGALWDVSYRDKVRSDIAKARYLSRNGFESEADKRVEEFISRLSRKWNDQSPLPDKVEPEEVTFAPDAVNRVGLAIFLKHGTGQRSDYFADQGYFAIGTGTTAADELQQNLTTEVTRTSMLTSGIFHANGLSLRAIGFFSEGIASNTYREGGLSNQLSTSGQFLLFRVVYPSNLTHTFNTTFVTLVQTIHFVPEAIT